MRQAGPERFEHNPTGNGLFENAAFGVAYIDGDHRWICLNREFARVSGYVPDELVRRPLMELLWPRDVDGIRARLDQLWRGALQSYKVETRFRGRGGTYFWVDMTFAVEAREDGAPGAILIILQDAELRKAAEERQRLLLAELNHRVRNMLATVQSMATQTWRHTENPARFIDNFSMRLSSLAAVHDVLAGAAWRGAELRELVEAQMLHTGMIDARRVRCVGPVVFLPPRIALNLSLVLHELATNAARHGALSADEGRVDVTWTPAGEAGAEDGLTLYWTESGGPPANAPERVGLGTLLIERAAAEGLDARTTLSWKASGLGVTMHVPIPGDAWRSELFSP